MSHIVVTSQSMNKNLGAPTPSCFVYEQVNPQPYKNNFGPCLWVLSYDQGSFKAAPDMKQQADCNHDCSNLNELDLKSRENH